MTQRILNIKVEEELKNTFMSICRQKGHSASLVLREFMKSYCTKNQKTTGWDNFFDNIEVPNDFMQERIQPEQQERKDLHI
ncbi:hypothetical protein QJU43_02775 [Pasteurella atlantica]|uniref:Uncharacterized protein n=2 Tax=Pasteurellaceae TaxID=712 RepID=A0ACC6HPQ2_9PAST|nr:hypothetical protein [Pasteurella atlantica]MDP8033298.1 hypothetical protein [Pasteurella atlantica]MDP8035152.1 hypothetical protein [Pasteurella atlantica]MDP8037102.1 hypothetical protein [Pasteurella atlantica]MDP8047289.1 hypothetical protein [Pasteurella atlantica]MDP8049487.1 hypothetical protein [Pasteurella atlantica]